MKYFNDTYVRRIDANRVAQLPKYPVSQWNCFEAVLLDGATTNNAMEGWHRGLNEKFPRAHMPLTAFLTRLKDEEEVVADLGRRYAFNTFSTLLI